MMKTIHYVVRTNHPSGQQHRTTATTTSCSSTTFVRHVVHVGRWIPYCYSAVVVCSSRFVSSVSSSSMLLLGFQPPIIQQQKQQQHHRHHKSFSQQLAKTKLQLFSSSSGSQSDEKKNNSMDFNRMGVNDDRNVVKKSRKRQKGQRLNEDDNSNNNNNNNKLTSLLTDKVKHNLLHSILPNIMEQEVVTRKEFIQDLNISFEFTILYGVSGGCDSIALLHILKDIIQSLNNDNDNDDIDYKISSLNIIHFNHQQRKNDSDQDEIFVQQLVEQMNASSTSVPPVMHYNSHLYYDDYHQLPVQVAIPSNHQIPTITQQQQQQTNSPPKFTQETARNWRRRTMRKLIHDIMRNQKKDGGSVQEIKQTHKIGLLVTAHHQDDSDETLLLKVLRGTHVTNIQGLPSCTKDNDIILDSLTSTSTSPSTPPPPPLYWIRPYIMDRNRNERIFPSTALSSEARGIRKKDIIHFLQNNNLKWREDDSNQSSKYLRNRVRNELIPLLEDMLNDKKFDDTNEDSNSASCDALHRRLYNLEKQSMEIRNDLDSRATAYIQQSQTNQQYFILPKQTTNGHFIDIEFIVLKHAIYQWIVNNKRSWIQISTLSETTIMPSSSTTTTRKLQVPYEQMERVWYQLVRYPDRQQWMMNIGNGYTVQRIGEALTIMNGDGTQVREDSGLYLTTRIKVEWTENREETSTRSSSGGGGNNSTVLLVTLPNNNDDSHLVKDTIHTFDFYCTTLEIEEMKLTQSMNGGGGGDGGADNKKRKGKKELFMFTPPSLWNYSRKMNHKPKQQQQQQSIRDFLREQKIPLHERKHCPILIMVENSSQTPNEFVVVAVHVGVNHHNNNKNNQKGSQWIMDTKFQQQIYTANLNNNIKSSTNNSQEVVSRRPIAIMVPINLP